MVTLVKAFLSVLAMLTAGVSALLRRLTKLVFGTLDSVTSLDPVGLVDNTVRGTVGLVGTVMGIALGVLVVPVAVLFNPSWFNDQLSDVPDLAFEISDFLSRPAGADAFNLVGRMASLASIARGGNGE